MDTGDCTLSCRLATCGDAFVWSGNEQCDLGPANADTGACTTGCMTATCGDGFIQTGVEACDDGAANADTAACTTSCQKATCGDGFVLAGSEECDSGPLNADTGACTTACKDAVCGDGLVRAGVEECDDGNALPGDGCNKCKFEGSVTCDSIHKGNPLLPSGAYLVDPDGLAGSTPGFLAFCDMTKDGGGWTLGFVKNSVEDGSYPAFGSGNVTLAALAADPAPSSVASPTPAARVGWTDLNTFPYAEMRLSSYEKGARAYDSEIFAKTDLRIAFGQPGYLLYGNGNGAYFWCGGPASYTDAGQGQINKPVGAPDDCKGHGSLGSGWDFSKSTGVNQGLTLCGTDAVSQFMSAPEAQNRYTYPAPGAAYAIWVR